MCVLELEEAKLCPRGLSQGPGDQQWSSCTLMADTKDIVGGDQNARRPTWDLGFGTGEQCYCSGGRGQATSAGSSSKLSVQRSRQKAHRAQGEHRMQPPTNMLCEPQPSTALMSCLGKVGQVHCSEIANLRY